MPAAKPQVAFSIKSAVRFNPHKLVRRGKTGSQSATFWILNQYDQNQKYT